MAERDRRLKNRDATWIRLHAYAKHLKDLPDADFAPELLLVQRNMRNGQAETAVDLLGKYFDKHHLDPLDKKPKVDHQKFMAAWEDSGIQGKQLARDLSVSPAAVSLFINGEKALRFIKVIVAAERIGMQPEELLEGYVQKPQLKVVSLRKLSEE